MESLMQVLGRWEQVGERGATPLIREQHGNSWRDLNRAPSVEHTGLCSVIFILEGNLSSLK